MATFDEIVNELQDKINQETIEAFGEEGFERWRNTPHRGKPPLANYQGASTGSCGDTIQLFLYIEDDRVCDAGFLTDGCGSSMISGSMAAELALNKHCDELAAISGEAVLEGLGGPDCLPEDDQHCAWLAANALHEALGDYYKQNIHKRISD
ncbi:iron-sulfur cluster assembly scaffold protein [Desulfovibrio ferrophilus]|uniref:Nitrogen-fixing NifU domain-containing protein n=1 Tax=Desulfovibrio ferrophilus TaxID=241368 RepID=A0A2Z6AWU4_9BACT|nr:iron-sulfur cluster assembly scaffold protein [Desulfovibrio ferrophilus]BBD07724.1 nitrogen-fixing NifU domain-containing protein [Desulfovibrio ferrophilus]